MNRANLIGINLRLGKVYGGTPIGIRIAVAYDRAFGERTILEEMLPHIEGMPAFKPVNKPHVRSFSAHERMIREQDAREARGEIWDDAFGWIKPATMLTKRQAI